MTHSLPSFSRFGLRALSLLLLLLGSSLLAQAQSNATPAIRYVRTNGNNSSPATATSWGTSTADLQGAINASAAGDQVWVAQGTYKPGGDANVDRTLSFSMKDGVTILGGFPASGTPAPAERNPASLTTTLSGDIGTAGNNSDNSYHVVNNLNLDNTAVLDGFVVRDGYAFGGGSQDNGGGMLNTLSSPTLRGISFQANAANNGGAGMYDDSQSQPTLTNCRFVSNVAAGGGGGIYNISGNPILTNCTFVGNSGSFGGGMYSNSSSASLINCLFQNNRAVDQAGGGLFNATGSSPTLINCSLQGNTSYNNSGNGLYNGNGSNPTLINCVLFDNGGAQTFGLDNGEGPPNSVTVRYSLLETGTTNYLDGNNNITTAVSPFVSATDARLNACCPAINAGDNAANSSSTDLAGNPRRYNGGQIDMGAYEYQGDGGIRLTSPGVNTATVNMAFSQRFTASGGSAPYAYSLASGSLPAGLSLASDGTLSGTPTQTGSFPVTVSATDANSCSGVSAAYTLTVNEPAMAAPFAITAVTTVACTAVLPNRYSISFTPRYSGLNGQPISFSVVNELLPTTEPGPFTIQLYTDNPTINLSARQGGTPNEASYRYDWLAACLASTTPNTPPRLVSPIPPQSTTVGVGYSYVIPTGTFTDEQTPTSLVLSAQGLPPGIRLTGYTLSGTASTTVGSPFNVTLTATDPGNLSVSTSFAFTVLPAPVGPTQLSVPFAITAVSLLTCTPIADRININFTPRYAGLNGQAIAFQVVNELAPTNEPGPYSLTLYRDNPVINLRATQTGSPETGTFAYDWLAACVNQGQDNTPPVVVSLIGSQTGLLGQSFELNIGSTFIDQETPISLRYSVGGLPAGLSLTGTQIAGVPQTAGVSSVTLTATDGGGLSTSTGFTLTISQPTSPTQPVGGGMFALTGVQTLSCVVVSSGQRSVTFTPQYAGLDGSPVSFSVVNEKQPTTQPGPYTLNLYTDNPAITLSARQGSTASSYRYNWLAGCPSGARTAATEAGSGLQITVLGNPIVDQQLEVVVSGVDGQRVDMTLVDLQGVILKTHRLEQAAAVDRVRLAVGALPGVFMLQVSTATERRVIKLLKP